MMRITITFLVLICLLLSCNEGINNQLTGDLPAKPNFTIDSVPGDKNRFIYTDLSSGNFTRVWEFGDDAKPSTSILKSDTVFYSKAGDYTIKLHISAQDGNGTNFNSQEIKVLTDAPISCNDILDKLSNGCTRKCWRFSTEDGAVKVGPEPFSGEWFTSNSLEPTQLDDLWCIDFENGKFEHITQGSAFSACQGYIEVIDYPVPPDAGFEYEPQAGVLGFDRLILTEEGSWFGIEDSGPVYDIISVSDTKLELLAPLKPCDNSVTPGYFTLTFVPE